MACSMQNSELMVPFFSHDCVYFVPGVLTCIMSVWVYWQSNRCLLWRWDSPETCSPLYPSSSSFVSALLCRVRQKNLLSSCLFPYSPTAFFSVHTCVTKSGLKGVRTPPLWNPKAGIKRVYVLKKNLKLLKTKPHRQNKTKSERSDKPSCLCWFLFLPACLPLACPSSLLSYMSVF